MSNVKELISEHPEAEYVLKRAGKIASKNNKQLYVVGGFVPVSYTHLTLPTILLV